MSTAIKDDYNTLLPIFKYGDEEVAQTIYPEMDRAIEKCTKCISKHSIEERGTQYVKWIDDTYLLMGKAHFYKMDFGKAKDMFKYVSGKFKEQEIHYDALLWLARTYLEDGNFERSERVLRLLGNDQAFPERLKQEFQLLYTDFFIKQQNYDLAISEMRLAIELTKKKKERARLIYILAQLYALQGENGIASGLYAQVIEMNPEYEMQFYARIQRALMFSQDLGGKEEIRKELLNMLDDDKNIEYRDQIYFALAELEMRDEREPEAIDYYRKSTQASVSNDHQKGLSFLKLGHIFFSKPEYSYAQTYYDSAVTFLKPTYPGYDELVKLSKNLNDLIEQVTIIETQDSLRALADMDEDERLEMIEAMIEERVQAEEEKKRAMQADDFFAQSTTGGGGGAGGLASGSGDWYFYNPSAMGFGASEFKKVWGTRKLEDNWRRSNKTTVISTDDPDGEDGEPEFIVTEGGDTIKVTNDWQEPGFYLKDLPLTDEQKARSDSMILEAYYALAVIYKERMEDNEKAIETLETMNKRFADNKYQLSAYYRLYRMCEDIKDYTKSDYYKNLILDNFPDSDYAKLIEDPEYFKRASQKDREAEEFYTKTYGYYERGFYTQAGIDAETGIVKYGNTEFGPKFHLLRAFAIGKNKGKNALITELESIVAKFGETPIGEEAQRLVDLYKKLAEEEAEQQEIAAADAQKEASTESPYVSEIGTRHNVIILVGKKDINLSNTKVAISNFNRANYRTDDLKVSSIGFKGDTTMVSIKSFSDEKRALNYLRAFKNDKLKLAQLNSADYSIFVISYTNYATFYKLKSIEQYAAFHANEYE